MIGDIVSISENSIPLTQLNNEEKLLTGTVTKVTSQSVSIAVDSDIENVDDQLNENDSFKIIKLSNEVTHKRIKKALLRIKEEKLNPRSEHLAEVLFLNTQPGRVICLKNLNKF